MTAFGLSAERVFLTEPLVMWRTWRLCFQRARPRIHPIGDRSRPWRPLAPSQATCGRRRFHRAPAPRCAWGLYGLKDATALRQSRSPAVIGTVALWGQVIEHELGYRAEFGYPQRLRLVCPECFWRRGPSGSNPRVVALFARQAALPLCASHLSIARECDLPIRSVLSASDAEGALLSMYAVDLLPVEAGQASPAGHRDGAPRDGRVRS
jgi:hypothetical protein